MNEYISLLKELDEKVREHTKGFYHSSNIVEYSVKGKRVSFDLRDISLICAIAGLNMLFTSRTGSGKTTFAKMFVMALFGEDYAFIQVDTKLDENKLRDIDFGKIKDGRNLSEAITETKMITAPAVIIDEYNRAPPQLLNILQGYLTNGTLVFEGGREFRPGVRTKSGERYQIKIGTINEGDEYYGTHKIDKASSDRFAVKINLDIFEPTEEDRRNLMRHGPARLPENPPESSLEKVLEVYEIVKKVPLSPLAEEFIAYFMRMNQCIKSPEGTKLTVTGIGGEFCKGCSAFAPDKGICGNVYAPSERTIANWISLSKAFALYRAYKLNEREDNVKVTIEDVIAAAPFVLYSKLSINPNWVSKYAKGSLYNAVNEVVRIAYDRFMRGLKENKDLIQRMINARNNGNEPLEEDKDLAVRYCEKDPWFFSKEYVKGVREIRESINKGR
jgi:MoxR-like ATPase